MKKRSILGVGKLIKGMGAYAIVAQDWQGYPWNAWSEVEEFKDHTVALVVEVRKKR